MFTELQAELSRLQGNTTTLFDLHPIQLSAYLDAIWEAWRKLPPMAPKLGVRLDNGLGVDTNPRAIHPAIGTIEYRDSNPAIDILPPLRTALLNHPPTDGNPVELATLNVIYNALLTGEGRATTIGPFWKHLIYAYLIENTRVVEIIQKVVAEGLSDEPFGTLTAETHRWLRTTEELVFRTSSAYFLSPAMSAVRPDTRATRRNAYQRMFGMDLNHGAADGSPYPYPKAQSANLEFVKVFQDLLRELWRGYINATNSTGQNMTDESNIDELIDRLKTMLNARRQSRTNHSNLLREEFDAVATLSWFEVSLSSASPLVADLKSDGSAPEEILRKLGERAKVAPHSKARSFFFLAKDLPKLLRGIEIGLFDASADARDLFKNEGDTRDGVLRIINHWSIATGTDLKSMPVANGPR